MTIISASFPAAVLASGAAFATPKVKAPGIKSNVTGFQVHHEAMLGAATTPISLDVRIRYHRRDYNMIGGSTTSSMTYEFEFLSNIDGRLRVATRDGQDVMGTAKDDHGCEFPPQSSGVLEVVEKTWDQWLGPLVPNLPPYTTAIEALRPQVAALLNSSA